LPPPDFSNFRASRRDSFSAVGDLPVLANRLLRQHPRIARGGTGTCPLRWHSDESAPSALARPGLVSVRHLPGHGIRLALSGRRCPVLARPNYPHLPRAKAEGARGDCRQLRPLRPVLSDFCVAARDLTALPSPPACLTVCYLQKVYP